MHANFDTILPEEEAEKCDPLTFVLGILSRTAEWRVDAVMMRTVVEQGARVPSFGRALRLPTGELLHMRARGFYNGAMFIPNVMDDLQPGETREFVFVVANPGSENSSATVLVAWRPFSDATGRGIDHKGNLHEGVVSTYEPTATPRSYGVYASNVLPLVLVDRWMERKKDSACVNNHMAIVNGATTLCEMQLDGTFVGRPVRGTALMTLTEWVAGVKKLENQWSEYTVQEETAARLCKLKSESAARVERALKQAADANVHGPRNRPLERVVNYYDARVAAQRMLETSTVGGLLDAFACERFDGLFIPCFSMPEEVPLWICLCALTAASPGLAGLSSDANVVLEDGAAAEVMMRHYRSTTTGTQEPNGPCTSTLEGLIGFASDDALQIMRATQHRKKRASAANTRSGEQKATPAAELIRRQGSMLLQEVFGVPSAAARNAAGLEAVLGKGGVRRAREVVDHPLLDATIRNNFARGVHGSTGVCDALPGRCATREQMQRVLLTMLWEVNRFCETGIYRDKREVAHNTPAEDAQLAATGIVQNVAACRLVSHQLSRYFMRGVHDKLNGNSQTVLSYPLRPCTLATCGWCHVEFDPRALAVQHQSVTCLSCFRHACVQCYVKIVKRTSEKLGMWPPNDHALQTHPHLFRCRKC
jgi:hypothetical protein